MANQGGAPPSGLPPNRLFVHPDIRSQVGWHASLLTCHPGARHTQFFDARRFWWSGMKGDIVQFLAACPVCSSNKTSWQPPHGLLHPLPVPKHPKHGQTSPWILSQICSPPKGNITILTIVDRFSKMVQFVPMSKLPSAKEIAEAVLYNVDRLHGFPRDIVSDRGPQFVARFWRDFCKLVVAFTSLNPTARQRG